jgi:hypothetical protein
MLATRSKILIVTAFSALVIFIACNKDSGTNSPAPPPDPLPVDPVAAVLNLPATPFNYSNIVLPPYLNAPNIIGQINTPPNNPITDNGATLGRVLFYDKNLSLNNTISCASCHKQTNAFSDPVAKSSGFNGGITGRNSMSLVNAKYYPNGRYFWDQRAASLEAQVLIPVQDMVEMGMTLPALETKLKGLAYYPVLFHHNLCDRSFLTSRNMMRAEVHYRPYPPRRPMPLFPTLHPRKSEVRKFSFHPPGDAPPATAQKLLRHRRKRITGLTLQQPTGVLAPLSII